VGLVAPPRARIICSATGGWRFGRPLGVVGGPLRPFWRTLFFSAAAGCQLRRPSGFPGGCMARHRGRAFLGSRGSAVVGLGREMEGGGCWLAACRNLH